MTAMNLPQTASPLASRRFLPALIVLFVGSGCAALVYEVVWLQLLQLVIGSSGISLGVLLGTFMGGMCLGSLILPRLISPNVHPLRVYAYLELGIGVVGLLVLYGLPVVADLYTNFVGHGVGPRAVLAAICLLPPTLLMGATLPAIARWVEATPDGVSWMGFFYGGNIVGAVGGCLLAGFYLLRLFDMATATYAAIAINVVVAGLALLISIWTPARIIDATPKADDLEATANPGAVSVYITIAMSGMCALGAEVVWTRLLSLMLGATVYTFSIILAVFLVGLGFGSTFGSFMARSSRSPRIALGYCQFLAAGSLAWAAMMITQSIPYWPVDPGLVTGEWAPWYTFQLDIVRTAWAVLPGAFMWGASFPLALAAVASRGQDTGRMVGGVYAANTVGAIAGSLMFSLWLIPLLGVDGHGTQRAQQILIALSCISALVALAPAYIPSRRGMQPGRSHDGAAAAVVIIALLLVGAGFAIRSVSVPPWIMVGFGRHAATWVGQSFPGIVKEEDVPSYITDNKDRFCIYMGEGMNVSVAVTESTNGWRYFHGAGKVQASSDPQDMRLQRMLGHLSVLAHEKPDEVKDVLVVACGAGVTAGSFIPYPNIQNVTICDIEPLVPTVVTPMFSNVNYGITDGVDKQNPRMVNGKNVTVVYDDGRHFIRTLPKDKKYDIITSDPIDPWVKGCAALNTVEYYQMCKDHLKPGGVMSLWIPLYESNEETAKSVLATFFKVFPEGILFSNDIRGQGYDAVLFGRAENTTINIDQMQERLDRAEYAPVKQSLVEVGFGVPRTSAEQMGSTASVAIDLLATYAGRAADLKTWGADGQLNYDSNLRLQYLAGLWLNSDLAGAIFDGILRHYRFPDGLLVGSPERIALMKQALEDEGRTRFVGGDRVGRGE